ncbi:response regulator [Microvirga zambiensis]|uniref:response regulator n=1 Tax=Microvirga zambiensis TaxID=1402137 RepID=UPI001FE832E1|nr:response regulator [Microvirga zambiensis]
METPLQVLAGCWILIVEDEYFLADELGQRLSAHGATLLGPVATLEKALALVEASERIDCAVIDLNLRGQSASPVADALEARNVPFVFATGYTASMMPDRYRHVLRWEKPYPFEALVQSLPALIQQSRVACRSAPYAKFAVPLEQIPT